MRRLLTDTRLHVGIDPDLHSCAWAVVSKTFEAAGIVRVPTKIKGHDALQQMVEALHGELADALIELVDEPDDFATLTVEGQQIYRGAQANPNSLLPVAVVAGAAAACALDACPEAALWLPLPSEWKGNVPKKIQQARSWAALEVAYEVRGGKEPYCVPNLATGIKAGDWKHAGDAVGLALAGKARLARLRSS